MRESFVVLAAMVQEVVDPIALALGQFPLELLMVEVEASVVHRMVEAA